MKGDRVIIYTILHMNLFIFNAIIIYEGLNTFINKQLLKIKTEKYKRILI